MKFNSIAAVTASENVAQALLPMMISSRENLSEQEHAQDSYDDRIQGRKHDRANDEMKSAAGWAFNISEGAHGRLPDG